MHSIRFYVRMNKIIQFIYPAAICLVIGIGALFLQSHWIQKELDSLTIEIERQKTKTESLLLNTNMWTAENFYSKQYGWNVEQVKKENQSEKKSTISGSHAINYEHTLTTPGNEQYSISLPIIGINNELLLNSATKFKSDSDGRYYLKLPAGKSPEKIYLNPVNHGSTLTFVCALMYAFSFYFLNLIVTGYAKLRPPNIRIPISTGLFIFFAWLFYYTTKIILGVHHFGIIDLNRLILLYPLLLTVTQGSKIKVKHQNLKQFGILIYSFIVSTGFTILQLMNEFVIKNGIANPNIEEILLSDFNAYIYIGIFISYSYIHFLLCRKLFPLLEFDYSLSKRLLFMAGGSGAALLLLNLVSSYSYGLAWWAFIIIFCLFLDIYKNRDHYNISYVIWWMLIYSGFISVSIFNVVSQKEYESRKESVSEIYHPYSTEILDKVYSLASVLILDGYTLEISNLSITDSQAINKIKNRLDQSLDKWTFKNQTRVLNFGCFDSKKLDIFYKNYWLYEEWEQAIKASEKKSENIYYNPLSQRYYIWYTIENESFEGNQLELLIEIGPYSKSEKINQIADDILVFKNNNLVYGNDALLFGIQSFPVSMLKTDQIIERTSFIVEIPTPEYSILSVKKLSGVIKPISVFSLCFSIIGVFSLILLLYNLFSPRHKSESKIKNRSSLRWKIQISVILLILFTFGAIAFTTTYYFNNTVNQKELLRLSKGIRNLTENIISDQKDYNVQKSKKEILRQIHRSDLSNLTSYAIFDYETEEWIYTDNKITSDKNIITNVFNKNLSTLSNQDIIYQSEVSGFFTRISNNPHYDLAIFSRCENCTQNKMTIISYLGTLLNVYVFLFLLAGAISLFIANSITKPLSKLADRFKEFKLGKTNTKLDWDTNDEIGILIKDYNELTHKLAESAAVIARTERDTAWREMARQVAHEIKNPLTPMKLSIQYLERAVSNAPERASELIQKVSATLVEQIDNLSQIAGEFSNFATLPKASNERIILNEVVEHIHDLFRKRDDMDINMLEPIEDIFVFADKNHLVRVLNNIVKNATQAIPGDRRGKIDIELSKNDDCAIVSVKDNGVGIPEDMKDKVFTPNFTTKSSGTGLGLAISANMMDAMNGRIYFESKVGEGTCFYIELPLLGYEQNQEDNIILDDEIN